MKTVGGGLNASGMRVAFVVGRFNELVVEQLARGAEDELSRLGGDPDLALKVVVPGAYEMPLAAKLLAESGRWDAVVCLGAVIRGSTPHFDYVAGGAASGLARVSLDTGVPVVFGVLTTDTIEQAIERAGTKAGNKGRDATATAIEMVNLKKLL